MVQLRRVSEKDITTLFSWANDSETRYNAIHPTPISWDTHRKWFSEKIDSNTTFFYMACNDKEPVGTIRFDYDPRQNEWFTSITVSPLYRRKGHGTDIILQALNQNEVKRLSPIVAYIKPYNIASIKSFQKAQFVYINQQEIDSVLLNKYLYTPSSS